MHNRNVIATLKGQCGLEYQVFKSPSGCYGFAAQNCYGISGHSLPYILDYLTDEGCDVSSLRNGGKNVESDS